MNVDEFLLISQFLDLKPTDVTNLPILQEPEGSGDSSPLHVIGASSAAMDTQTPLAHPLEEAARPWGNQPEQLVRLAFALGCDIFLLLKTTELTESSVPENIMEPYKEGTLPIKLDSAYHHHNNPIYTEQGLSLTLSFDGLRTCFFPWHAFEQVIFLPIKPKQQDPENTDSKTSAEADSPGHPHLRIIK